MEVRAFGKLVEGIDSIIRYVGSQQIANGGAVIAGQLDETSTGVPIENGGAPVRITLQRALHTNLRDGANGIGSFNGTSIGGAAGRGLNCAGVLAATSPIVMGEMAFGTLTGSYQTLLTGLNKSWILYFANMTNQPAYFSVNAASDHFRLEARSTLTVDMSAGWGFFTGTISVKHSGVAPTSGLVYCMAMQGPSG